MFKKIITCIACIIPITACSVNFFRGEFGQVDHIIALSDFIRAEWHLNKTGEDPYSKEFNLSYENNVPDYIKSIYPDDVRFQKKYEKGYLFEIEDIELIKSKDFLYTLFISPCTAKIMGNESHYNPKGLGFPFGRMKSIIRCQKGYYKLEQVSENLFVIKY